LSSRRPHTSVSRDWSSAVCSSDLDRSVRGVTFRGKGGTFCAGGDLKGFHAITQGGQTEADVAAFSRSAGELFHAVNELPQVTVLDRKSAVAGSRAAGERAGGGVAR